MQALPGNCFWLRTSAYAGLFWLRWHARSRSPCLACRRSMREGCLYRPSVPSLVVLRGGMLRSFHSPCAGTTHSCSVEGHVVVIVLALFSVLRPPSCLLLGAS